MKAKVQNIRNRKRDKEIFELRERGMTFPAIGKKYRISSERTRALYLRYANVLRKQANKMEITRK